MKVFIAVLVLIISFQSWTKVDDISEFEIEGMSIGDSLLDYFSEEEINNGIRKLHIYNDDSFYDVEIYNLDLSAEFVNLSFSLKKNDKLYKIYQMTGFKFYKDNVKECFDKVDEMAENISKELKDLEAQEHAEEDKEKLKKYRKAYKQLEDMEEELVDKRHYYDLAEILLRDSGIKTKIIRQYLPIMNKLINKYLASMEFFVQFELDEEFNEQIKSRYRDTFTYSSFSEGEKMRIDLALLFTWRSIAKLKNSVNTNLLMLDEVFDSSLDEGGTDEFLKILNTLGKDTNTFIISHKGDSMNEKFNNVIEFVKAQNFSRVV